MFMRDFKQQKSTTDIVIYKTLSDHVKKKLTAYILSKLLEKENVDMFNINYNVYKEDTKYSKLCACALFVYSNAIEFQNKIP